MSVFWWVNHQIDIVEREPLVKEILVGYSLVRAFIRILGDELRSAVMKKKVLAEAEQYRFDKAVDDYETFIRNVISPPAVKRIPYVSGKKQEAVKKAKHS